MEENKQHVQLPNNNSDLTPKDQLVYLSIRRFMNNKSKIAFPSLAAISKVSGAAINTIRESIKSLEAKDYFKVVKKGKSQEYHFNELKAFEPFSYDFLDKDDLSFTEKSYIVASQQYMFKDVEGVGKMSYSNEELSEKINMPESTISRINRSLVKKNYLTLVKNDSVDLETGCRTDTKIFNLRELGQAIIWTLKDHEDRINQNSEEISALKDTVKAQGELIQKLLSERSNEKKTFSL